MNPRARFGVFGTVRYAGAVDADDLAGDGPDATPLPGGAAICGTVVRRHRLSTRLWHWLNAVTVTVMLMSGLMIFNAHPRLYWGTYGANPDPAWLEIGSDGNRGVLRIGGLALETTGVLGQFTDGDGVV